MDARHERKQRLDFLLRIARKYRAWTQKQLADALGRDQTKISPESGNPKMDFIISLAGVLDWTVEDVVEFLWRPPSEEEAEAQRTFDELDDAAIEAHVNGQYVEMVEFGTRAIEVATTSEQRAMAWNRIAGGWDGQGRYPKALSAVQNGLEQAPISDATRLVLESNLANAYYTMWAVTEARAIARNLLEWYADHPPQSDYDRLTHAFAYYVRGHSRRRQIQQQPENVQIIATEARSDLETSGQMYNAISRELDDESYAGIANTCRGGMLECEVTLGRIPSGDALDQIIASLDEVVDVKDYPAGDWLESHGWWCIFGCNIALRATQEREQQQYMAILTNKAHEIAERLGNWALWERVFTMEFARRQRLQSWTGIDTPEWVLDSDDLKLLVGTMGRFPSFRDRGLRILETARVVEGG